MKSIIKRIKKAPPPWLMKLMLNIYPPYLGAGISVDFISEDYRTIRVKLNKRWYNANYVGTHFGGSIYSMTDPFYMLMLMMNLGSDYIVWDKAAHIDFKKPGKNDLTAEFAIGQDLLDKIISETSAGDKYIFDLPVDVVDEDHKIVARMKKTLYVRRK